MRAFLQRLRSQQGASLAEYALIASLIALPSLTVMGTFNDTMTNQFLALESSVESEGQSSATTAPPGSTPPDGTTTTTTTAAAPPPRRPRRPPPPPRQRQLRHPRRRLQPPPPPRQRRLPRLPRPHRPPLLHRAHPTNRSLMSTPTQGGLSSSWRTARSASATMTSTRAGAATSPYNPDGSVTVYLWERRGSGEVYVTAWVDTDGYLHITSASGGASLRTSGTSQR